jgi:hypothetical protein
MGQSRAINVTASGEVQITGPLRALKFTVITNGFGIAPSYVSANVDSGNGGAQAFVPGWVIPVKADRNVILTGLTINWTVAYTTAADESEALVLK